MALQCPECAGDDLRRVPTTDDSIAVACESCGHEWTRAPSSSARPAVARYTPADPAVAEQAAARTGALVDDFLAEHPEPRQDVAAFREQYQRVFTAEGLGDADPEVLREFAASQLPAFAGPITVLLTEWNRLGDQRAAVEMRAAIAHLLRGPGSQPVERRFTDLATSGSGWGMKGFREALLMKVLCVVHPAHFLPVLVYDGASGKRAMASRLYGIDLPEPKKTGRPIGYLAVSSNDLLREKAGDRFVDLPHFGEFLWWAHARPETSIELAARA
jgi:hypothetical protein